MRYDPHPRSNWQVVTETVGSVYLPFLVGVVRGTFGGAAFSLFDVVSFALASVALADIGQSSSKKLLMRTWS